jgi:predicted nuclease of predicted toxin-antitoxin system
MKYLLDEHVNPAIRRGLLRANPYMEAIEVSQHMPGASDPELIAWATAQGYIFGY